MNRLNTINWKKAAILLAVCFNCFVSTSSAQTAPWTKSYANPAKSAIVAEAQLRLDLNGTDNLEFTRVKAIIPQSDGSFLVANGATNELRVFDAQGKFVLRSGGKGSGPGEYTGFTTVAPLPGDSLAVLDNLARRVSILARNGVFVRSASVAQPPAGLGSAESLVGLPSGDVLVGFSEVKSMAPQRDAIIFYDRFFTLRPATGALEPSNIRTAHSEHFVQATTPSMGGVAYWNLAFGKETSVRGTRSGFIVADAAAWTIEQHAPNGALLGTHRVARGVQLLTTTDRDHFRTLRINGLKRDDGGITEKMVREMPYPVNKPAYARVEVERGSDRLWVLSYASEGDTQDEWLRLDPQASVAESVLMPARFRALAFTATHVYGVWRDSDDVEHVRVYALLAMRK